MTTTADPGPGVLLSPLEVTDLTLDGGAVARLGHRVVFLDRGLPGEILTARVSRVKKRLLFARVEETLAPSPHAREPWCPHFGSCGGCAAQDLTPEALLEWKARQIGQTIARIGGLKDLPLDPVLASPLSRGHRNKMTFAFAPSWNGVPLAGMRKRKSRDLVEVPSCGLMPEPAMSVVAYVRQRAGELGLQAWSGRGGKAGKGYLRFLTLRMPALRLQGKPQLVVECITGPEDGEAGIPDARTRVLELGQELLTGQGVTGFVHWLRKDGADLAEGEKIIASLGQTMIFEQVDHITLAQPPGVFLQTNTGAAALLYRLIAREAGLSGTETLWDVYCGAGGIGLYLADKAGQVHGFDLGSAAVEAARRNAEALGYAHCFYHAGELRQSLRDPNLPPPDVIVADPPRAGMQTQVVDALNALPAQRLLYVSCDVATQARDLARLAPAWEAEQAFPVDMFPHALHVENVILLRKKRI